MHDYTGSEINFFRQAPTGDQIFFFSRQMEKCGRQKVSVNVSYAAKHKPKLLVTTGLLAKYLQSM